MALTLAESAKLSNDMVQRGVIETIIEESPILQVLPFETIEGNSFKYNQENTLGGAAFFAVNATWTEATATFTQKSASLAILGGDADVDNFIQRVRSNIQDQRAVQTQLKAKSVARQFETSFITGDVAVDANAFDGIRKSTAAGQTTEPGVNGGALTLALVDTLVDLVKGGKPHLLMMSKRTRRRLKALLVANTHYIERGESAFGRQVMMYDGIPVEVSDFQPDDETLGTGTALSSIYGIQFSAADGVVGLQNGGLEVIDLGQLESKDAQRALVRLDRPAAGQRHRPAARTQRELEGGWGWVQFCTHPQPRRRMLAQNGAIGAAGRVQLRLVKPSGPPESLFLAEVVRHGFPVASAPPEARRWRARNLQHLLRGLRGVLLARWTRVPTLYGALWLQKIGADPEGVYQYAPMRAPRLVVVDYGLASLRVVTTAGVNYLVDALQNLVEPELLKFHAIGTGVVAEAVGDTTLGTEWGAAEYTGGVRATGSLAEGASANIFRTVGTNTKANAGTSAVTEHGVLSQAALGGGTLLDRSVFAAINLVQNDALQTTFELSFMAGG
jgi:hypothetical protein